MSLSKETLAEIENELRSLSRSAADSCRYNERTAVFGKPLFVYLSELADRIDAAWKRERDELIYSFDPTKAGRSKAPDPVAYAIEGLKHQYAEPGKIDNCPRPVDTCGNNAAVREALVNILKEVSGALEALNEIPENYGYNGLVENAADALCAIRDDAEEALKKPSRNCDVGTAEEQAERYHATGEVYHTLTLTNALEWAQMPYEADDPAVDQLRYKMEGGLM